MTNGGTTEGQLPKPEGRQTLEGSIPSASIIEEDLYQADFLEMFLDQVKLEYEIWAIFHVAGKLDFDKEAMENKTAPVREFFDWLEKETERTLHVKRAPDNKSFFERRELARSRRSGLSVPQSPSSPDHVFVEKAGELSGSDLPSSS